jgi:hypothetical protein
VKHSAVNADPDPPNLIESGSGSSCKVYMRIRSLNVFTIVKCGINTFLLLPPIVKHCTWTKVHGDYLKIQSLKFFDICELLCVSYISIQRPNSWKKRRQKS